jgi:hypothetical protein
MGDYRRCLGATFFCGAPTLLLTNRLYWLFYPVHPGNAKQAMEPATLWFERRVRKVQTCDKRQTLSPVRRAGSKGGDYPPFL